MIGKRASLTIEFFGKIEMSLEWAHKPWDKRNDNFDGHNGNDNYEKYLILERSHLRMRSRLFWPPPSRAVSKFNFFVILWLFCMKNESTVMKSDYIIW